MRMMMKGLLPATKIETEKLLKQLNRRNDRDYIMARVNYYCKKSFPGDVKKYGKRVGSWKKGDCNSVYYYDLKDFMRGFGDDTKVCFLPGDITYIPQHSSLVKSRPIAGDNARSVVLKFNRVRHFIFVKDLKQWSEKLPVVVFRGKARGKVLREALFATCFGKKGFDLGETDRRGNPRYITPKMTISQQLDYKYIFAVEGNDVASNLKWIMSSNSIAVMPRPVYETWYMEGKLQGDVHYLEVAPDFSDVEQKINWLEKNPDKAVGIIRNANKWALQFRDKQRERLITKLTIAKYLGLIN